MKITFELTPVELEAAIQDGSLTQLLKHATTVEKIAERAAIEQTATTLPGPGVQMPGSNVPPAMIVPAPAANVQDFQAAVPPAAPTVPPTATVAQDFNPTVPPTAPLTPAPQNTAPVAPGTAAPTIDQVRATLAPLIKVGKEAQMQALFKEFGAEKLTDIPAERYGELITRATAL